MNSARVHFFVAAAFVISPHIGSAQELSRYRSFVLESSLESVVSASGARGTDARTVHERPARIQELEWRRPYVGTGSELADPVRGAVFMFYDDALYQVVVSYDRDRTDGLTNSDVIASLTTIYGEPLKSARTRPPAALAYTTVLAQWDGPESSLTLLRGNYAAEFQLILASKALSARARDAIREAERLDAVEAPRLELERRKKEAEDAADARDEIRTRNKSAFRP